MAFYKNKASQKIVVLAVDADGDPVTGDAANISAQISLDGGACAATDDAAPTELDATDAPGLYIFDATQAETNADMISVYAVSSTDGVVIDPLVIYTQPETRAATVAGGATSSEVSAVQTHGDSNWATATGFSTHSAADVWAVTTRTLSTFGTLVSDIATAVWGAATRTLSAFGFTVETDTASRNASKADVSGLSTLDAAGVRAAVGLAAADLDTQLDGITAPTVEEIDAELSDSHGTGLWGSAQPGSILYEFTVTTSGSDPIMGVLVEVSTDAAKTNVVQSDYTDALGVAAFNLLAGTYYMWGTKSGYNFPNPVEVAVS